MKHILIASGSFDRVCTEPVAKILMNCGYKVTIYEANRVAQGLDSFAIKIGRNKKAMVMYRGSTMDPTGIAAAWFRRPSIFSDIEEPDIAREESLSIQYRGLQRFLWESVPDERWFNAPTAMRRAEGKLSQLEIAKQVGFTIPETVVSNQWQDVLDISSKQLTLKMVDGVLRTREGVRFFYAKKLHNDANILPLRTAPYPGIWQAYIEKAREWRITVVGKQTFNAAIYTDKSAKDDWRLHQYKTKSVQFKAEPFPEDMKKKCFQFLKRYNLTYGAFDFIEQPDGKIVFLELNPSGQYGWLEEELDFPISKAIAKELVALAEKA
jgi:hypothetical protein